MIEFGGTRGLRFYKIGGNFFLADTDSEDEVFEKMFKRRSPADPNAKEINETLLNRFGTYTYTPPNSRTGEHAKVEFIGIQGKTLYEYMYEAIKLIEEKGLRST